MNYPKVLVISNNSFSLSNSNGRTLGLLFNGWPKEKLSQFCITSDGPDWEVCDNYFCASDIQVLKSTLKLRPVKRNDLTSFYWNNTPIAKRIKRTSIKSLVRHFVWRLGVWRRGDFDQWVNTFSPEIVLIQSGDTAFTHDLARCIANKYKAKLVFFNTEGIYFLKQNYLYKGFCDTVFFPLYKYIYKLSYKKAMYKASYAFYLNELIRKDNDEVFNVPGTVIYNTSSLNGNNSADSINRNNPVVSYFGNMGYDRSIVLVEVARLLRSLNLNIEFNVYGKGFPEAIKRLEDCEEINYQGFIPYSELVEIIRNSDIVLHVESQNPKHAESLRYGFSTKIADCLSCGKPFLLFSSRDIACAQYLIDNDCAWVATNLEALKQAVKTILFDDDERNRRLKVAQHVAMKNHSIIGNCTKFQQALISLNEK